MRRSALTENSIAEHNSQYKSTAAMNAEKQREKDPGVHRGKGVRSFAGGCVSCHRRGIGDRSNDPQRADHEATAPHRRDLEGIAAGNDNFLLRRLAIPARVGLRAMQASISRSRVSWCTHALWRPA